MTFKTTAALNVRSGPGAGFELLDTLQAGDLINEVSMDGWCAIEMDDGTIGYASRKYLVEAPAETATAPVAVPTAPASEPPWIVLARKYLGTKEVAGSGDNPTIVGWDKLMTTLPASMQHDATRWCAIFVHAMLLLSGYKGKIVESALAVDWLNFGTKVTDPKVGDVVVFDFGGGDHHVAFVISVSGGMVHVIGGNQSDAVTLASYGTQYVMGYLRAA